MFFFLLLGAIEVIAIIIVYRLIEIYIIGAYKKRNYKITSETNVLLTGAAMGAGKFLAMNFAKKNKCNIIIYDIREDLMGQVIEEIQKVGAKGYFYKCDVSDEQELERTVETTLQKFEKIDILINNVGIANLKFFTDVSFDEIQKAVSVNFLAPVSIIKKILPGMIKRDKGHIVNVSSVASLMPSVKMTDYCASKAALSGFHNALRLELKQQNRNIHTTLICPYAVNTGVLQGLETKLKSLFPILDENTVADEIYNAILEQRQEVFIPQSWKQGALFLRALPTSVIDYLSIKFLGQVAQKLTGKHLKKKE